MIGDGTFLMSPSELATAVQDGLKVTVLLMDNHGYQVIRRLQMATVGTSYGLEFRNRGSATKEWDGEYVPLDFVKLAEGMGARGWRVETEAELEQALREARAETRPCLINIEIEKHVFGPSSDVWWDVAPAEVSSDEETRRLRAAYEEGREAQRYYG